MRCSYSLFLESFPIFEGLIDFLERKKIPDLYLAVESPKSHNFTLQLESIYNEINKIHQ